jgi:hypothetical protein
VATKTFLKSALAPTRERELALLAVVLALGTGLRLWIGFTNYGDLYDVNSLTIVSQLLASHPLHVYEAFRWPYPGGYFPIILLCRAIANSTGMAFWAVIKTPNILADAGIAITLWWGLGRLGASRLQRWGAVALVELGPSFVVISGFHGQIDPTAILPALVAVVLWRLDVEHRAVAAGVLVGLGAAVKTVPLFAVLAMLPTARDRREAATLVGPAVMIPVASVLPFLIADAHWTVKSLTVNRGIPGWGGLSLLVDPTLVRATLGTYHHSVTLTGVERVLYRDQNWIVAVGALLAAAVAWKRRMEAPTAAAWIFLVILAVNPDPSFQYFVWGLPFFLLVRRGAAVAILQAILVLPTAELYFRFAIPRLAWTYEPLMVAVWLALLIAVVTVIVRGRGGRAGRRLVTD